MAEVVGTVASVIAIAELTYKSVDALYKLIDGMVKAPKTLTEVKDDLSTLKQVLDSIKVTLEAKKKEQLSDKMRDSFKQVEAVMDQCGKTCKEFGRKLREYAKQPGTEQPSTGQPNTGQPNTGHISTMGRATIFFKKDEILAFQYRISSYKLTLDIAMALANL